jgi:hypothetical protein
VDARRTRSDWLPPSKAQPKWKILSPGDVLEEVFERINLYFDCGVNIVWTVNPHDHEMDVQEHGKGAVLFSEA